MENQTGEVSNDVVQEVVSNPNEELQKIVNSVENIEPAVVQGEAFGYAGFWVRFAAMLVDGVILVIPMLIANVIFGERFGGFVGTILMWTYSIYMLNTRQATLGKMAVGLKVTTADGLKPTVGKLVLREILGKALNVLILYIGFIMIGFTKKKQGLHDMIANTVVVYDPEKKRRRWLVVLGIFAACIIPIGLILSIILVSLQSARNKALDKANEARAKQEQISKEIQMQDQN